MKGERLDSGRKKENCIEIKNSILSGFKLFCEVMERNPKALDFFKETTTSGGMEIAFKFIEEYRNSISSNHCVELYT